VLYAIGNSGEAALAAEPLRLLDDPAPLVRGAAVWALSRLLTADGFEALREERLTSETDEQVREEWATPSVPLRL
jgi:epoxyqueuosine reductase